MTTTPALARATEALRKIGHDGEHGLYVTDMDSRVAVSAALHGPDDDVIARTLTVHSRWTDGEAVRWIDGANRGELVYMCSCGRVLPVDVPSTRAKVTAAHAAHQADAVRAAILGPSA